APEGAGPVDVSHGTGRTGGCRRRERDPESVGHSRRPGAPEPLRAARLRPVQAGARHARSAVRLHHRRHRTAVRRERRHDPRGAGWDPNDPAVHIWLGHAYERQGDLDRARARFEEARRLRPSEAYPVMQLGLLAERRRDPQAARDAIRTALALDPHNVAIRWDAAILALRLDDREQALDHLRYVLAVDPAQRDAAFQLGRALLRPDED